MSPRATAEERLERILYILPAAAREGGAALTDLARALGVDVATVVADIEHVTAREFYHPGGSVEGFSITLLGDRVSVRAAPEFDRPVRLNAREALALSLGLRVLAAEADVGRATHIHAFARRIEAEVSVPDVADAAVRASEAFQRYPAPDLSEPLANVEYDVEEESALYLDLGDDDARGVLADAIELGRRCGISYLKPGDSAPAERRIEPYTLVYGDGNWYVLARDVRHAGPRVFRLDRVLHARMTEEYFAIPASFDPATFFAAGRGPFHAEQDTEVAVRYSPRIARWIAERTAVAPEPDGSVVVRHRVADTRWIVRHVLQYGGDAVIEDAGAYRRLVRQSAERIAG